MKLSSLNSLVAPEGYEFLAVSPGGWAKHVKLRTAIQNAVNYGSTGTCQVYLVKQGDKEARVNEHGYVTWLKETDEQTGCEVTGRIGTLKTEN